MAPAEAGSLRTPDIGRGDAVTIRVDGREVAAHAGETVLGAMWAAGLHTLHTTARANEPRGFFCGMGACFDCLVTVDGRYSVRACLEPVRPGMSVTTQQDAGTYPPLPEGAR